MFHPPSDMKQDEVQPSEVNSPVTEPTPNPSSSDSNSAMFLSVSIYVTKAELVTWAPSKVTGDVAILVSGPSYS